MLARFEPAEVRQPALSDASEGESVSETLLKEGFVSIISLSHGADAATLDVYLTNPKAMMQGTKMSSRGWRILMIANLVAYLARLK